MVIHYTPFIFFALSFYFILFYFHFVLMCVCSYICKWMMCQVCVVIYFLVVLWSGDWVLMNCFCFFWYEWCCLNGWLLWWMSFNIVFCALCSCCWQLAPLDCSSNNLGPWWHYERWRHCSIKVLINVSYPQILVMAVLCMIWLN